MNALTPSFAQHKKSESQVFFATTPSSSTQAVQSSSREDFTRLFDLNDDLDPAKTKQSYPGSATPAAAIDILTGQNNVLLQSHLNPYSNKLDGIN